MQKRNKKIPVNRMMGSSNTGIAIEQLSFKNLHSADESSLESAAQSHRHDGHSFFLLEEGTITIQLDFETHQIAAPTVLYVHPDQVHRTTTSQNIIVSTWTLSSDNLHPEYLELLADITPARPLPLQADTFSLLSSAVGVCLHFAEQKEYKLYHSLLKDGCNALTAVVLSLYSAHTDSAAIPPRFEAIAKAFRRKLEQHYFTGRRPADYARMLNISASYLNECISHATGHSVSHQIQQRVVLEAKRLLYHSDKPVKEVAASLGYDDYPYFSRLFTKVAGISPLSFRSKNRD